MLNWTSTFTRFPPGGTPLVGPIVVRVTDWSRPQAGAAPISETPERHYGVWLPLWDVVFRTR